MIKRYKRLRNGWMRRTSRIYLKHINQGKATDITHFLNNYSNATNYAIIKLWSKKNKTFNSKMMPKEFTDSISKRFEMTARLAQCVAKQAKECVRSQGKKSKRKQRIPRMRKHIANLDSRFVDIDNFNGSFDMCIQLSSGVPKLVIPFNKTQHMHKFINNGWLLSKSIRLGYNINGLFIDLIFEKEKPKLRKTGKIIGIDRGFLSMLYTSDRQNIGSDLHNKIKVAGKRRKAYHRYITTEENRSLKNLDLTGVNAIVLEDLKHVKRGNRGKFSRNNNRLLSFWHYAKVGKRLEQLCEELGVSIYLKNPWKTSQRCPVCGKIDRRNRRGKRFHCLRCDFEDDSDYVGAKNLEFLGLAGVYSLRLLKGGLHA